MSAVQIPQEIIESAYGPMLSAMMIQQLLLGIVCVQVFDYYRTFPKDIPFYKALVALLFVLNLFLGATNFHALYFVSVTYYGNFEGFDIQAWTARVEPPLTVAIGLLAQMYFLERCYRATLSIPVTVVLGLMVLASFAFGIATTIAYVGVARLSLIASVPIPITGWLITTAVTDLSIAVTLVISLIRSKTPFQKTERVIFRIVRLSMETSCTTAVVAILNLILYYAYPSAGYIMLPQLAMARIYTSAVMVTLASRVEIRNILMGDGHSSYMSRGNTTADDKRVQNIMNTPSVAVRTTWQDPADIELGRTRSRAQHEDHDTSFGDSKTEGL